MLACHQEPLQASRSVVAQARASEDDNLNLHHAGWERGQTSWRKETE